MNLEALPSATGGPALYVLLLLAPLVAAVLRAPWRALLSRPERRHAFFACLLVLPALWCGAIEVDEGIRVHLLGLTPVVLIFGWELAVIVGVLAGVGMAVVGAWEWPVVPLNVMVTVGIPVLVTQALLLLADRLPRTNLFVYLLGVGFLGGALSSVASLLTGASVLGWEGDHALVLLLAFPEGFVDGAVVTALTVFYPSVMRTYDDTRYLGEP